MMIVTQGGFDKIWMREIDVPTGALVSDGFEINDSRAFFEWIDRDHVLMSADYGEDTPRAVAIPAPSA